MLAFISLAALMLLAALAFVVPPLLRGGAPRNAAGEVRRKLRALEQARSDGILDDTEYAAKRAALGEALLAGVDPTPKRASYFRVALMLALLLPAAAIVLYRLVGAPHALDPAALVRTDAAPDHAQDMQAAIAKLVDKLKQNPNDVEGWALLGRAQKSLQHFAEARDALKRAHELAPDEADITVEYAEALALASADHRLAGQPRALIDAVLKTQPAHQRALWLTGIAESQERNYDGAIAVWNKLLPLLPADSDVAASIKRQIAQAQALRDGKPLPADDETATAANASTPPPATAASASTANTKDSNATDGPHITVEVALDPKLKDKVAPGDVLFVYAKAAQGPPMPVAIAKLTAAQLPASVTLTDGMGMLPSMKLSTFPQVIIGARISKSGNAIAQSGDLQTLSAPLPNSRSEAVQLTIDQIVP
ncbi:MAG: c-type cytochrome biogenesis protein CcmI [Gammaproteobacteria bacterium]|nr:MAG: c-type cytochrome biogenesis protein CcmI [Gammaproteobacteria bacterium]